MNNDGMMIGANSGHNKIKTGGRYATLLAKVDNNLYTLIPRNKKSSVGPKYM